MLSCSSCPGSKIPDKFRSAAIIQLRDVEPLCRFLPLGSSQGLDVEFALRHYQSMVSPAVGTTHGLCHSHVLYVPLPGDDIVDHVPMHGSWMHPRSLVAGGVRW